MSPPPNQLNEELPILRRGAVAVIVRAGRLLIIRRSQHVIAPGLFCFPGGGIEAGETEQQAVVRELQEELGCAVRPLRRLWENISSWHVHLAWWLAEMDDAMTPVPNPAEVESFHWFTLDEMGSLADQLESNIHFLAALKRGEVLLPI